MKKILFLLFVTSISFSQNANRKYISHQWVENTLEIKTSDGKYRIEPYSDKIIETSFIPNDQIFNAASHAVVLNTKNVKSQFIENVEYLEVKTEGISAKIQLTPFQISYFNKNQFIISEKNGYTKKDSTEILDFNLNTTEVLYGGGSRALGMNRRGNRLQLYNKAQYGYETRAELMGFSMPIVISSNKYMLHFDNPAIGFLDLDSKKDNILSYETISGRKTYQIILGDSWQELVSNYTQLTGKQPMPPRWAFGNLSSRFGYHSQKEAEKVVAKFRAEKIPVDGIIFDLYWFGKEVKGTMGNLEIDRDSFPDFEKMVVDFNKKGVKTILITEPFILTTSKRWKEAVEKKVLANDKLGKPFTYDFYFGNTGLIDIFKPEGKDWFWGIYKGLAEKGVAGWWGDLGEPEMHPSKLQHATGSADEVHNIYGHNWAKLIFEGYQNDFSNQRPFILMRSGYSGSQRFGMIPWSGDVNRSWGGLQSQIEIALQMGMQGIGYMHSDLGGFAGANLDDELYTRWLQYGVFQPIFRPHAQEEVPSEPIFREEKTKTLAKQSIELRYKMLAYNYTLAFDNNQSGMPFMRPLLFEEPKNEKMRTVSNEYLWGDSFLVAPVTEKGQKEKEVYFPATNNWYDFYSNKKYDRGSTQTITLVENTIPVFVRGGAFVPLIDLVQTTKNYSSKNIALHYYYDATVVESSGHMYNDEGETPNAYEKGRFELLHFKSKLNTNEITISIENEKGKQMVALDRTIELIMHNVLARPKTTKINGKKIKSKWDAITQTLSITFKFERNKSKIITVQLSK